MLIKINGLKGEFVWSVEL